jgi:HK97 family phage major capsid protein
MNDIIKRLNDRRLNLLTEARTLADQSAEENRQFSPEEQGRWDGLNTEIDSIDKRMRGMAEQEKRSKETADLFNRIDGQPAANGGNDPVKAAAELRAFLKGDPGAPRSFTVKPEGTYEQRVLSKLTVGAGGNLVPVSFYDRLMAHLVEVSGILQAGPTIINTDSGETLQVPKTTTHPVAALVAEAGTLAASDPVFAQGSLGAYKYGIIIQLSRELIADTGVDVEGYLAMSAGRALGNALGAHLATGSGTAQPTGIVTSATLGVTGPTGAAGGLGATSATLNQGADLLFDMYYSVIAPYRASKSCAWLTRDANMAAIRKIKATTGEYIFQPSMVAGTPDTLIGKPIFIDPFIAAIALSAKSIVFGDISQFFVRIAGGVRFERSDEFAFSTDLVSFRALLRADSLLIDQTGAVDLAARRSNATVHHAAVSVNILRPDFGGHVDDTEGTYALAA